MLSIHRAQVVLEGLGLEVSYEDSEALILLARLGDYTIRVRYIEHEDERHPGIPSKIKSNISLFNKDFFTMIKPVLNERDLCDLVWCIIQKVRFNINKQIRQLNESLEPTIAPFEALRIRNSVHTEQFLEKLRLFNKPLLVASLHEKWSSIEAVNVMDGGEIYLTVKVPEGVYICESDLQNQE